MTEPGYHRKRMSFQEMKHKSPTAPTITAPHSPVRSCAEWLFPSFTRGSENVLVTTTASEVPACMIAPRSRATYTEVAPSTMFERANPSNVPGKQVSRYAAASAHTNSIDDRRS